MLIHGKELSDGLTRAYYAIAQSNGGRSDISNKMGMKIRSADYYIRKLKEIFGCDHLNRLSEKIKGIECHDSINAGENEALTKYYYAIETNGNEKKLLCFYCNDSRKSRVENSNGLVLAITPEQYRRLLKKFNGNKK